MAQEPARLADLEGQKGVIDAGADADFAVFDPDAEWMVTESDLRFRHKISPYLGAQLLGRVRETWLRGELVYRAGEFVSEARGREQARL
jgi:allantoinase